MLKYNSFHLALFSLKAQAKRVATRKRMIGTEMVRKILLRCLKDDHD
jgi:hypothetical protein